MSLFQTSTDETPIEQKQKKVHSQFKVEFGASFVVTSYNYGYNLRNNLKFIMIHCYHVAMG